MVWRAKFISQSEAIGGRYLEMWLKSSWLYPVGLGEGDAVDGVMEASVDVTPPYWAERHYSPARDAVHRHMAYGAAQEENGVNRVQPH